MKPTLDKIQAQEKSGKTLAQHKYYSALRREDQPHFIHDIYPFGVDYYHELNPFFLINILQRSFVDFAKTITVRDGKITFASFMVENFQYFKFWNSQFIIHPSLTSLIPPQFSDRFLGWQIQQDKDFDLKVCNHLLIAGIPNLSSVGSLDKIEIKLQKLTQLPRDAKIEVLLPIRKDPFESKWREDYLPYEISSLIKKHAQERPIRYVKIQDLLRTTSCRGIHLMELFSDNLVISDSYLPHFVVARGGISDGFDTNTNSDILFELDLSFHHKLQIVTLPRVESFFNELMFYKKFNPSENYYLDPGFKALIEKQNSHFLPKT